MRYPAAERQDIVEELFGHRVADPYRWLEDRGASEAWLGEQAELCRGTLDALPGRERLRARYEQLLNIGFIGGPQYSGTERSFFVRRLAGEEHAKVLLREADGTERVVLDPMAMDPSGLTTLDAWAPSWDARRIAYQVSVGGNEESWLHVMETDSGREVEPPIDRCRYSSVSWLPDGSGFYYVRKLHPTRTPAGEEQLHRRVYLHRCGSDPDADDVEIFGGAYGAGWYLGQSLSMPDGRWLVLEASRSGTVRNDVYILDTSSAEPPVVIHAEQDVQSSVAVGHDGRLYIHTNLDAPRGRLCVADPVAPGIQEWVELVPEGRGVLEDATVARDHLVLTYAIDATTTLAVHDRASGEHIRDIELPGIGRAGAWSRPVASDDVWFTYSDYATPAVVYHHDLKTSSTKVHALPPGWARQADIATTRVFVDSPDGTRVPLFLVHRAGVTPGIPGTSLRPLILNGYGGFNLSMGPAYSPALQAWAEAGGVYAIACLRGGSEYGDDWHRGGRRESKQNVFDDFIACAEWLIASGWTDRERLGISGGSNGGLLVGAALTQRPELFSAVVCSAPLLDMVRYEKSGLGATWNDEYGRADVEDELGWLLGYSPYHRVTDGVDYPAVLFTIFDSDTRVDPMHGRKMCAALQAATASDRPIILRCERDVGHGARSISRTIDLMVDTTSWMASRLHLALD